MRFFALLSLCLLFGFSAVAERRAFVVGVGDYAELTDLNKTLGDANGYETVFKDKLAFSVTKLENPTSEEFLDSFDAFLATIAPGDEVAFVFSGHGWSDGSDNFLALTDAPSDTSERLRKKQTISLSNEVLGEIRDRRPGFVFAVIDACRDNPFASNTKSMSKGLVPQEIIPRTLVVFAAGDRQKALDRLGDDDASEYSVFTRSLLPKLSDGSRSLMGAVDAARDEVSELASSVGHSQRPALYSDISIKYCFDGECRGEAEDERLKEIFKNPSLAKFEAFKANHPNSRNADFVNHSIDQLSGAGASTKSMSPEEADYSGQYVMIPNAAISGHNIEQLRGVSVPECKAACDAKPWCLSFDFHKNAKEKICDLSDKSAVLVKGLKFDYDNDPYDHYGKVDSTGFVAIPNAAISGHNNLHLTGVGVDACKQACGGNALCASFDYHKGQNRCDISTENAVSVKGLKFNYPGNPYDHYAKGE